MFDPSINTFIAKYFITFVELAVGESMNPSKLRFQGASSIIRSDTQACKWGEVQWDHFNKDQKWNEYTFRPGSEVQQKDTSSRIRGTIPIKKFWTRVRIAFSNIMPSANDYWPGQWMVQLDVVSKERSIWILIIFVVEGCSSSLLKMVWTQCWWQRNWFCLKSRPKLQLNQ